MALRKGKKRKKFLEKADAGAKIPPMRSPFDPGRIRAARKAADMRQEDLAGAIGCGREHISNIERGRAGCSYGLGTKIAKALGVPVEQLFRSQGSGAAVVPDEQELMDAIRRLTPECRTKAYYFILGLTASGGSERAAEVAAEGAEIVQRALEARQRAPKGAEDRTGRRSESAG